MLLHYDLKYYFENQYHSIISSQHISVYVIKYCQTIVCSRSSIYHIIFNLKITKYYNIPKTLNITNNILFIKLKINYIHVMLYLKKNLIILIYFFNNNIYLNISYKKI